MKYVMTAARPNSTRNVTGPAIVSSPLPETAPAATEMTTSAACSTNAVMMKMAAMLNQRGNLDPPPADLEGPRNTLPGQPLRPRAIVE